MNPLDTLGTAIASLGSNKMRAGLTVLGIVIGVASVISLLSIGRGSQATITARIEALGTNLLFVRPGSTTARGVALGLGSPTTLTLEDAVALEDPTFAPSVLQTAAETTTNAQAVAGRENTFTRVLGVTSSYLEVRDYEVAEGRGVSPADVLNRMEVAVLGSRVAETLFPDRNPVGQTIRLNGRMFGVVGVLESKGGSGFGIEDDQIMVPLTTAHYRLNGSRTPQGDVTVSSITVQTVGEQSRADAEAEIETILRLRHRTTPEDGDDFTITSQQDTIETLEETTETFVLFLGAVAGISLLVGGIGIMNIMLVSVTERTREIGIRRAVGAKRRDILLQFVTEATVLSVGGGLAGVALGTALSQVLNGWTFVDQTFNTVISTDVAVFALVVSGMIGLFFGIYPAARAARLDPITALRHE